MKKVSLTCALTIFLLQPIFVSAEETCVELKAPVTSVADFDANGIVNRRDIALLAKYVRDNRRVERRAERRAERREERAERREELAELSSEERREELAEQREERAERRAERAERAERRAERNNQRASSDRSRHNRTYEIFYSPIFDRNADGEVNYIDLFKATRDMRKRSTPEDQELATISNEILAGTFTCVEPETVTVYEPTPVLDAEPR